MTDGVLEIHVLADSTGETAVRLARAARVGQDGGMNILRSFARPMLAAPFIVDGLDALARPSRHVEKFEKVAPTLERAGLPPVPPPRPSPQHA